MAKHSTCLLNAVRSICIAGAIMIAPLSSATASPFDSILNAIEILFEGEEAEFRMAIDEYFGTVPGQCLTYGPWPFRARALTRPTVTEKEGNLLSSLGLADVSRAAVGIEIVVSGKLTKAGEKYYYPEVRNPDIASSLWGDDHGAFCVGRWKVEELIDYTEPTPRDGATVTKVRYRYRLVAIPRWASDLKVYGVFPKSIDALTGRHFTGEIRLVRTNKGWRVGH